MKKISLIIPCYNEELCLSSFDMELNRVIEMMKDYQFEVLFVDDGSKDNTLSVIKKIAMERSYVRYLSFSRNFGKEAAMYAGFCNATGDYVAIMDADLQDPPSLLPEMVEILETKEYDSIAMRRVNREGEPLIRSFFARMFYKIINKISDADIVDGARDYRLMKKEMVDCIVSMGEQNRFSKGIFGWIGYRTYWYEYKNVERVAGETKWSFWKLLKYSIEGIVSFSQVPLNIASWIGFFCTITAFFSLMFIIIRKLLFGDSVQGWASNMCAIIFMGGIQLFCLGIMGQYIGKIYIETKKRPHYIASECSDEEIKKIA